VLSIFMGMDSWYGIWHWIIFKMGVKIYSNPRSI